MDSSARRMGNEGSFQSFYPSDSDDRDSMQRSPRGKEPPPGKQPAGYLSTQEHLELTAGYSSSNDLQAIQANKGT